jgi:uncharacterized protein
MNTQERSILENFLTQLVQVRGVNKDPEADRLIRQAFEQQPDAAYLLVQRALLLSQALDQAKARVAELEQTQVESGRGFLDPGASGWASPGGQPAFGAPTSGRPVGQPPQYPSYSPPPPPGYSPYAVPAGPPASGMGGMSSFLGQAAATAAGVAGGAFLFEGIENLFGHHGSPFGGSPFAGPTPAPFPTEDVTINNYYYPEETPPEEFSRSVADSAEPDIDTFTDDDSPADDFV